jgi:primosomal protein N' (replication factor Y)
VIVQTQSPEHPALVTAQRHEFVRFAAEELPVRERTGAPPFRDYVRFVTNHRREETARAEADRLAFALARAAYRLRRVDTEVIGPAPCFTAKVRGEYFWQVVLAGHGLNTVLHSFPIPYGWTVDVDPVSLL